MSDQYRDGRASILRPGQGPVLARGVPVVSVDGGALGAAARVPMLDVEAAGQPGRAIAAGGAAIGQAADAMTKLAERQLQMINERKVYEAEAAMDELRSKIATEVVQEPDETKWESIAESTAEAARGALLSDDLSPDARDEISSRFVRWKAQTVGQTRIESAKESRKKLVETKNAEVIRATHAGNMDLVRSLTQGMVAQGLIGADDAARMEIQAESRRDELVEKARRDGREETSNRFLQAVEADPWEAKDAVEKGYFPEWDESDKTRARAEAERAINARQRDVIQKVRDGIVAGAPDTDDTGIEKWAKTARLGPEDVAALKEFRKNFAEKKASQAPMDRGKVAALFGKISKYQGDEKTDPQAARWGELVQEAEILTAGGGKEGDLTRGALMQSIYQRHPFQEKKEAEIPDNIERLFIANIEAVAAGGGFGVEAYNVQQKQGLDDKGNPVFLAGQFEKVPNPAAAIRRIKVQNQLYDSLKADWKANPDKWLDPEYMDEWLYGKDGKAGRLGTIKAGAQVQKMRAQSNPVPSGDLFPRGIYSDPVSGDPTPQDFNNTIKQ